MSKELCNVLDKTARLMMRDGHLEIKWTGQHLPTYT